MPNKERKSFKKSLSPGQLYAKLTSVPNAGLWRSWERATLAVWRSGVRIPYAPFFNAGGPLAAGIKNIAHAGVRTPQRFSVTACRSSLQGAEMQLPELSSEAPPAPSRGIPYAPSTEVASRGIPYAPPLQTAFLCGFFVSRRNPCKNITKRSERQLLLFSKKVIQLAAVGRNAPGKKVFDYGNAAFHSNSTLCRTHDDKAVQPF